MNYKILARRSEETVFTTVEYDFDGEIVVVEVAHFMPQSEEDITLGIENRSITEQRRLQNGGAEVA